jgi:ankyrin repeat protein
MSAPFVSQQLDAASYSAVVVEPALAVIRKLLLQDHPTNVIDYICERRSRILSEIEAAASSDPRVAAFPPDQSETSATAASPIDSTPAAPVSFPSVSSSSAAAVTAASAAVPTLLSPRLASAGGNSAALSTASGAGGKFDTFVMPCGKMEDFHKGVTSRIGFPHLEFEKTMEAEHTRLAGCDMRFTTRNYGITTTANAEWGVVVRGQAPPPEHMLHGRIMVSVEDKLCIINEQFAKKGLDVRLRREEVIAVILYTGPMYMMYNCVLARWSNPAAMWDTLRSGNNLFTTTLSVLVSAVQKLSTITVIPDGLKLYRGTGGLVYLPEHFSTPDDFNCRGMTEWGFMSCSADKEVAMGYSGAAEGRPHAMVLEIEPSFVDRGAVVSELSQYPHEKETLFLPMSYVAPSGQRRVEHSASGEVTVIPVRVSVNLKAERVEQLEEKKKSIHLTGFEFRVNELQQRLQRLIEEGGAEARLKKEKDLLGHLWKKAHSVEGYVEAQVKKVDAVLLRHRERAAADYSDDDVYRKLVSESLEAARMAESAVLWWLRDKGQAIYIIEDFSLHQCQRHFESFLRLECMRSGEAGAHRAAAVELCRSRNLLRVDVNERDENGMTGLIALAAWGGSADDVRLLVAAGADVEAVTEGGSNAIDFAAQQGHAEIVEALARAGADCNQVVTGDSTPLLICSGNGHLRCVEVLLKEGADVNKAKNDGSTPLFMASQNGHCDVVDALLRGGADVNKATKNGATPLFYASRNGHCDVVDALLLARADVTKARDDGSTPLCIASSYGHRDVVVLLSLGGADVNKAADDGVTPLYLASENGHCDVVDALLRGGADVNKATSNGVTPLYMASEKGHCEVVHVLLLAGADLTLATGSFTPYSVAFFNGNTDMMSIMESAAPEGAQQLAQQCARVEADHSAAIELHRTTGCVVVNRHRGRGCVTSDYVLQLQGFNTFVADVRLCGGCFYFELQVIELIGVVQFGFCTDGFEARRDNEGEGAGDDAWSWAVDGIRLQKWHEGPNCFGSEWAVGDVIGFAVDMRTAGAAVMRVSVNGSFGAPNGVAFSDMNAPFLSPAFSGYGRYRVNFGDRPFAHAPPEGEYTSVHEFHRQRQ